MTKQLINAKVEAINQARSKQFLDGLNTVMGNVLESNFNEAVLHGEYIETDDSVEDWLRNL